MWASARQPLGHRRSNGDNQQEKNPFSFDLDFEEVHVPEELGEDFFRLNPDVNIEATISDVASDHGAIEAQNKRKKSDQGTEHSSPSRKRKRTVVIDDIQHDSGDFQDTDGAGAEQGADRSDKCEVFAASDPGTGYPATMPNALPGPPRDSMVFPLPRRPILDVGDKINYMGQNLDAEGWLSGQPYAVGFSAWSFKACDKFVEPEIDTEQRKKLIVEYSARHGLSTNKRIEGASNHTIKPALSMDADFLRPMNAHQNKRFMAGLLGFPTVGSFIAFLDMDVARIIAPAAMALFGARDKAMASFSLAMGAMSKITKTKGKLINTLQKYHGTVILENSDGLPVTGHDPTADKRVDKSATLFVLMYRLITFFPIRFPDREKPGRAAIFGFHPNAWSAAYLLIASFKAHRGKTRRGGLLVPVHKKTGIQPGPPFRLGTIKLQQSDGNVEPEEQARLKNAAQLEDISFQNSELAAFLSSDLFSCSEGEDAEASAEEIKKLLSEISPEYLAVVMKHGRLDGTNNMLVRIITDAFQDVADLSYQYTGEEFAAQRNANPFLMPDPLSDAQRDKLIVRMREYAGIKFDKFIDVPDSIKMLVSKTSSSHTNEEQSSINIITERQLDISQTDAAYSEPTLAAESILELTKNMTGGFEPDSDEYAAIVEEMQFGSEKEPRHSSAEKDSPPLKPHQAVDVKWIMDKSEEAARAAILASDCGTGKTLAVLTALVEATNKRINAYEAGDLVATEPGGRDPTFMPSFYLCPNTLVHQIQEEWQRFYRGFLNLYTCYGKEEDNISKGDTIVPNSRELEHLLKRLHQESNNPETAKSLILIPYSTARTRLATRVTDVTISKEDILLQEQDAPDTETEKTKLRRQRLVKKVKSKRRHLASRKQPKSEEIIIDSDDDDNNNGHKESTTIEGEEQEEDEEEEEEGEDIDLNSGVRRTRVELVYPDVQAFWVICDEGHYVKNPYSRTHSIVASIPQQFFLIVTATPLLNSVRDIEGYLALMWRREWPFGFTGSQEDAAEFYEPETWEAITNKRPSENSISVDRCVSFPGDSVGDESQWTASQRLHRSEFEQCIRNGNVALFRMNPKLFHVFAEKKAWDINVSLEAIKPIMRHLSIRRSMRAKLKLSDCTIVCPGDGIPAMKAKTVELEGSPGTIAAMRRNIGFLYEGLFNGGNAGASKMSAAGNIKKETLPVVNFGNLRKIAMSGFHLDFYGLCSASSRNLKLLGDPQCRRVLSINKLATDAGVSFTKLAEAGDKDPDYESDEHHGVEQTSIEMDSETLSHRLDLDPLPFQAKVSTKKQRGITSGGVKECNLVRENNVFGGLRFFFYIFRKSRAHVFPATRVAMAETFTAHSPKLAYTVMRALELQKEGKRLLIYGMYPATCLLVEALLNAIGVRTMSIRSQNSGDERARFIAKFKNSSTKVDALVIGLTLGAFGLNFQSSCHHGIILEEPTNISTKIQTLGRINRIGQENSATWELLYSRYIFDGYLLAKSLDKYVVSLASETHLDERITGELASICLHELVRLQFGMEFNAYPISRVPWGFMDKPAVRRECLFYSALAQALMSDPQLAENVQKADVAAAALRWEVGEAVTADMLNGTAPTKDHGLELRAAYGGDVDSAAEDSTPARKRRSKDQSESGNKGDKTRLKNLERTW